MNLQEFAQDSIDHLVALNTERDLTEAIAICVRNLKDPEGKLVRVQFTDDFEQEMDYYRQIAKMLRGNK